eukprot:7482352-Pyramimonas_sp.AAC.1
MASASLSGQGRWPQSPSDLDKSVSTSNTILLEMLPPFMEFHWGCIHLYWDSIRGETTPHAIQLPMTPSMTRIHHSCNSIRAASFLDFIRNGFMTDDIIFNVAPRGLAGIARLSRLPRRRQSLAVLAGVSKFWQVSTGHIRG